MRFLAIATFIAAIYPQHVRTLLSIEAFGGYDREDNNSIDRILESYKSLKELLTKKPKEFASKEEAAYSRMKGIEKMYKGAQKISFEACLELVERCCKPDPNNSGKIVFSHDSLLRQPNAFYYNEEAVHDLLKKIVCPIEVVLGNNSNSIRSDVWDSRISLMKNHNSQFKVHYLDGYHHLHLENPKPIAEIFIQLIRKNNKESHKSKL